MREVWLIKKALRWIDINFEAVLASIFFFALLGLIVLQIFLRNVVGGGLQWGEEICRFLYVWVCYIGVSYGLRMNSHITINAVTRMLPEKVQRVLIILVQVIFLVVLIYLFRGSVNNCIKVAEQGQRAQTLNISSNWMFAAAPIGYGLSILRLIQNLVYKLRRFNASWDIFVDSDGNYSGAINTFCYPEEIKAELQVGVTKELMEEARKYSPSLGKEDDA